MLRAIQSLQLADLLQAWLRAAQKALLALLMLCVAGAGSDARAVRACCITCALAVPMRSAGASMQHAARGQVQ